MAPSIQKSQKLMDRFCIKGDLRKTEKVQKRLVFYLPKSLSFPCCEFRFCHYCFSGKKTITCCFRILQTPRCKLSSSSNEKIPYIYNAKSPARWEAHQTKYIMPVFKIPLFCIRSPILFSFPPSIVNDSEVFLIFVIFLNSRHSPSPNICLLLTVVWHIMPVPDTSNKCSTYDSSFFLGISKPCDIATGKHVYFSCQYALTSSCKLPHPFCSHNITIIPLYTVFMLISRISARSSIFQPFSACILSVHINQHTAYCTCLYQLLDISSLHIFP